MATWPATLPQLLQQDGFTRTIQDPLDRFTPEVGEDITTPNSSSALEIITGIQELEIAQLSTLWTFYNTTLRFGSLRFDWTHPILGTSVEFKFRKPPTESPIGSDFRVQYEFLVFP